LVKEDATNKSVSAQIVREARRAPHTPNISGNLGG